MHFAFDLLSFILGAAVSGVVCTFSSKYLGWFNKQVKSIETKVP
jgi:hypothetical protein